MRDYLKFFATFVRHPFSVGAVAPSSKHLGSLMIEGTDLEKAATVVELGPGTGAFTRVIVEAIEPGTQYLAVELDTRFSDGLARRFPDVRVVNDSAERLPHHLGTLGRDHADVVFCGLPWASFPPGLQRRIMTAVVDSLAPGGRFATFAYVHAAWFPTARKFHKVLKDSFSKVTPSRVEWRNLPPAFVYHCEK